MLASCHRDVREIVGNEQDGLGIKCPVNAPLHGNVMAGVGGDDFFYCLFIHISGWCLY